MSLFAHFEKISLTFSSLSFVIHVNLKYGTVALHYFMKSVKLLHYLHFVLMRAKFFLSPCIQISLIWGNSNFSMNLPTKHRNIKKIKKKTFAG